MRILYFGDFDPEYARNRVIVKGLREHGNEVVFCHTAQKRLGAKIKDLKHKRNELAGDFDAIIVGYSDSRSMVPLARFLFTDRIIWDAFYSVYDMWVWDRQLVRPGTFKALRYWFSDWLSCMIADAVLLDTDAQIDFFAKTFSIDKDKFTRILIGADDSVFHQ